MHRIPWEHTLANRNSWLEIVKLLEYLSRVTRALVTKTQIWNYGCFFETKPELEFLQLL